MPDVSEQIEKQCSTCRQYLPTSAFWRNRSALDGLQNECKRCRTDRQRSDSPKRAAWRAQNSVRVNAARRMAYAQDPNSAKDRARRYRSENFDKVSAKARLYDQKKPEIKLRKRVWWHRKRTESTSGGAFTREEWLSLLKAHGGACAKCGSKDQVTIDHIVPVAVGGSSDISNIQPICRRCNGQKHKTIADYRVSSVVGG